MSSIRNVNSNSDFMHSEIPAYSRRTYTFYIKQAGQICHFEAGGYKGSVLKFSMRWQSFSGGWYSSPNEHISVIIAPYIHQPLTEY